MGKCISATIVWLLGSLLVFGTLNFIIGTEDWIMTTIEWAILSALGFFFGYKQRQKDEDENYW